MGAFTISATCDGCGAEINRRDQRFGCRRCWEISKAENRTFCERCATNHPEHKPRIPVRIQLSRAAGWRKPEGAVVVSRPTKWGNPHTRESLVSPRKLVELYLTALCAGLLQVSVEDVRRELRGKDLCCWCPIGQPCHADVLLEIANG